MRTTAEVKRLASSSTKVILRDPQGGLLNQRSPTMLDSLQEPSLPSKARRAGRENPLRAFCCADCHASSMPAPANDRGAGTKAAARAETPALSASSQASFAWLVWEREFRAPPTDIESPGNRQRAGQSDRPYKGGQHDRRQDPYADPEGPCRRGLDLTSHVPRSQRSTPTSVRVRKATT
jgi:hypothetical protein